MQKCRLENLLSINVVSGRSTRVGDVYQTSVYLVR